MYSRDSNKWIQTEGCRRYQTTQSLEALKPDSHYRLGRQSRAKMSDLDLVKMMKRFAVEALIQNPFTLNVINQLYYDHLTGSHNTCNNKKIVL